MGGEQLPTLVPQNRDRLSGIYRCLAHERRRRVLSRLEGADQPQTLPDLAEYAAAREAGSLTPELDEEYVTEVYLSLYHTHVPKLVDAGLVRYEQESDTVEPVEYSAPTRGMQEIPVD